MQTSQTRKAAAPTQGLAARSFELDRAGIDEAARTVALSFSSETPYERWFGIEVLSHKPGAVRLDRMRAGGALLADHNTRDQIGVVESVKLEAGVGRALVRFSKGARGEELFRDVVDGIRRHVSVGYIVHSMVLTKTGKDQPDEYLVDSWEPIEVSIVSVPADPTVGVGRGFGGLTEEQQTHLTRAFGTAEQATPNLAPATPAPTPEIRTMDKTPEQLAAEAADLARNSERANVLKAMQDIITLGERYKHLGGANVASEYLRGGKMDVAEFQATLLAKIGTPATTGSRAADVGLAKTEVEQFSFLKLIRALANPTDQAAQRAAGFELEASAAASAKRGGNQRGMAIPSEVLRAPLLQRDLTVGAPTGGGNLVSTDLLASSFIDLLRNRMALTRLGARTLTGLVGDIAIPRQSGAGTAYWVAESGAPTESAQTVDQVTLSPKTVGAYTDFSRKLMLQSSIDVEAMVRSDLAMVLGLEIDRAALYGTGAGNQPSGLKIATGLNTSDFAADTPTFAEMVGLESLCAADNADVATMAYLVNATGRGALKGKAKDAGSGLFVWENGNTVNGYRAEVSNQVAANDFWFGNWADVMIGYWSGLDILVDPYTGSTSGTIRVVALQDVDVNFRHGESFARGNNTL